MNNEVIMIPIAEIHVLNPRHRDQKKFEAIVNSIKTLGLKMPITVSLRAENEPAGLKYDLVCGQGRMEAFIALGHHEIPAIVVEITKEERLIRSLVESGFEICWTNEYNKTFAEIPSCPTRFNSFGTVCASRSLAGS